MISISITPEAFEVVRATLPHSDAGESYSEMIIRLAKD
jgi:hypothetical protein